MSTAQTLSTVNIPAPLRAYTNHNTRVSVAGKTAGAALEELVAHHPQLKPHLYDEHGRLRSFVNIYVNDEDIRYLDGEATVLGARDEISIVPSIAGGCNRGQSNADSRTLRRDETAIVTFRPVPPRRMLRPFIMEYEPLT